MEIFLGEISYPIVFHKKEGTPLSNWIIKEDIRCSAQVGDGCAGPMNALDLG